MCDWRNIEKLKWVGPRIDCQCIICHIISYYINISYLLVSQNWKCTTDGMQQMISTVAQMVSTNGCNKRYNKWYQHTLIKSLEVWGFSTSFKIPVHCANQTAILAQAIWDTVLRQQCSNFSQSTYPLASHSSFMPRPPCLSCKIPTAMMGRLRWRIALPWRRTATGLIPTWQSTGQAKSKLKT